MNPNEIAAQPIAGGGVVNVVHVKKQDLSDWVELMEAVEALCPEWPAHSRYIEGKFCL